jgi:hypothetical protein
MVRPVLGLLIEARAQVVDNEHWHDTANQLIPLLFNSIKKKVYGEYYKLEVELRDTTVGFRLCFTDASIERAVKEFFIRQKIEAKVPFRMTRTPGEYVIESHKFKDVFSYMKCFVDGGEISFDNPYDAKQFQLVVEDIAKHFIDDAFNKYIRLS